MKKDKFNDPLDIDLDLLKKNQYTQLEKELSARHQNIKRIKLNGSDQIYYVKSLDVPQAIVSSASSKLYSTIGINTPHVQTFKSSTNSKYELSTIQPDATQNKDIELVLARDDTEYQKIFRDFSTRDKWQIIYDANLQDKFLKHMTPQCLEALINIYLIDELRSDKDRHLANYFLYKTPNSKLYEGVVVIDLDQMNIFKYAPTRQDFSTFLTTNYTSYTPTQREDMANYINRIHALRELIDEGMLSSYNIETMVKALKHDFPQDVKQLCKKEKLSRKLINQTYSPIARLWEYNQKELGKDLGI